MHRSSLAGQPPSYEHGTNGDEAHSNWNEKESEKAARNQVFLTRTHNMSDQLSLRPRVDVILELIYYLKKCNSTFLSRCGNIKKCVV